MKTTCVLFGLSLLAACAVASPIVKREAESEDLSPLNEVSIFLNNFRGVNDSEVRSTSTRSRGRSLGAVLEIARKRPRVNGIKMRLGKRESESAYFEVLLSMSPLV